MRISREARILFAFVILAAAAWLWFNLFSQSSPGVTTSSETDSQALQDTQDTPSVAAEGQDDSVAVDAEGSVQPQAEEGVATEESADEEPEVADAPQSDTDASASSVDDTEENAASTEENAASSEGTETAEAEQAAVAVGGAGQDEAEAEDGEAADTALADAGAPEDTTEADVADSVAPEDASDVPSVTPQGAEDSAVEPTAVAPNALPAVDGSGLEAEASVSGDVDVAAAPPVTARDVEVAELPFLVTEPPAPEEEAATLDEEGLELSRPRSGLRATVNPFSPLVLQAETVPATAPAPPSVPTTPTITEVPIPGEPTQVGPGIAPTGATTTGTTTMGTTAPNTSVQTAPASAPDFVTPTPRPLTPSPTLAADLPRPLPGGMLASTPDILRTTRVTPVATPTNALGSTNLADVAALRLPGQGDTVVDFADAPPAALGSVAESGPVPLGTSRGVSVPAVPQTSDPLAAGVSSLSRYLRDNNYRFTGSVIGPVGVGVFRSNVSATPITVVLGKALPDTDIVLTSLKGKQAEFTQNDEKQVLTLDLR